MFKKKGRVQYAVIKTMHGIQLYLTERNTWSRDWWEATLYPNETTARQSVISRLKDFNTKRFIDGCPAT